jgi:hypothetical protein
MGLLNAMCRALVNEPCNDTLFSCRTIQAMEKTTPLHESTARLYRVARDVMGDDAPAKVARRINVSAQTLQNWEGRGVSQDGALKAQAVYGCDANWLLGTVKNPTLRGSQPLRLDPTMLAETHRTLRDLEDDEGRVFSLEQEAYAAWFVQVYELRAKMPAHPTAEAWVEFGRKLHAITQGAARNERDDGVPAQGAGKSNLARKVRG